jgi:hypothetical protein
MIKPISIRCLLYLKLKRIERGKKEETEKKKVRKIKRQNLDEKKWRYV